MAKAVKPAAGRGITVYFSKTGADERVFRNKTEAKSWIMAGLMGCEGAERDHYVSLLQQLEMGLDRLDYDS